MPGFSKVSMILFLVVLIGAGAATAWAMGLIDPKHEATARFERRSSADILGGGGNKVIEEACSKIKALTLYNFKGRVAIERVANDVGLRQRFPMNADGVLTAESKVLYDELITSLSDSVTVEVEIESPAVEVVAVKVRHQDKHLASKLANKLVENYLTLVREELGDTLVDQKKFFEQEVDRFRRKLNELESAKLRFAEVVASPPGVDPLDPVSIHNALAAAPPEETHARAMKRLNRLRELSKDKPIGDEVILELYRLEEEVAAAEEAMKDSLHIKETLEKLSKNTFHIRSDYLKIEREMAECREQLEFWMESLRATQMALTLNLYERGMRVRFVERAPD